MALKLAGQVYTVVALASAEVDAIVYPCVWNFDLLRSGIYLAPAAPTHLPEALQLAGVGQPLHVLNLLAIPPLDI